MRKRWCCRPDTTRADFGAGNDPFSSLVSLSSSLPAGGPPIRDTVMQMSPTVSIAVLHIVAVRDFSSESPALSPGRSLLPALILKDYVDSIKPALFHEDRPMVDLHLGGHSSFGNCDHN